MVEMNGKEQAKLKVLIADDDPLVRRVLRDTLEKNGVTVIAETGTGRETTELVLHYQPDLLVLDLLMPDGDGIDVIRRVRSAGDQIPIVVLTASEDEEAAMLALRAGAVGFLSKDLALSDLPRTLRKVLEGEAAISRRLGRALIERLRTLPDGQIGVRPVRSALTPREWEVLDLLCAGRSTDDIASNLVLSIETVRSHVKSILRKMGVGSRAEAVAMAPRMRTPTLDRRSAHG
jgi:DNA-binding NarL/FixJ family response regulator